MARPREWPTKYKVDPKTGCWIFQGAIQKKGYGIIGGSLAHRAFYKMHNGPIVPASLYVLHKCDNPPCVNPDHLFLGTQHDNMQDMVKKGRLNSARRKLTHCKWGHEFTPENTRIRRPDGTGRICIACQHRRNNA